MRNRLVNEAHKHLFSYAGGEARCKCGMYLQPDGSITKTVTGESRKLMTELAVSAPLGLFVRATPTTESMKKIQDTLGPYCQNALVDDLHCTVIYSKEAGTIDLNAIGSVKELKDSRYKAVGRSIEFWDGHDNDGYIVLKLDSYDLVMLNRRFQDQGVKSTFPDYTPHVTLVTPADKNTYSDLVDLMNALLQREPLKLEFYYAGYTLHTESTKKILAMESFGDDEYYVRQMSKGRFEVAVFKGKNTPNEVYEVTANGNQLFCSCPGYKFTPGNGHKHVRLVSEFIKLDRKPASYWFNPLGGIEHKLL